MICYQLVRLDTQKTVAAYHREERFLHVLRMSRLPRLEVDRAAMDTLDSLISKYGILDGMNQLISWAVSFLLFERQRRDAGLR